jgi:glycine/D-amino acid oxidase-like deaminating enzyme
LISDYGISCACNPSGVLLTAAREKTFNKLRTAADLWRDQGAAVTALDKVAVASELTTDYYLGGVIYHDAGTLNPLAFARGLAAAALREGARLHTLSPVHHVAADSDGWRLHTPQGRVLARRVVIASGAAPYTPWLQLRHAAYRLRVAMVASAPFAGHGAAFAPGRRPFTDMDSGDTFGGAFDPDGRLVMSILPGFADDPSPAVLAAPFWRKFRTVFPQAPKTIPWDYGWFGEEAVPAARLGKIYAPAPQLFIIHGYGGNGIVQAVLYGRKMAEYLLDGQAAVLPLPFAPLSTVPLADAASGVLNKLLLPMTRHLLYR